MNLVFYTLIVFVSFAGFLLAFYIRHKKQSREVLVCPIGSDCDAVIHSEYSRFWGLPVEVLGIFYYAAIGVGYGLFLARPGLVSPLVLFGVLILSAFAFLFSLYLTSIQAFVLRQWCAWCLTSASFCLIIFVSALLGSDLGFAALLSRFAGFINLVQALGLALGFGAATITAVFLLKFLRDWRISEGEAEALESSGQIIWFSLAVVVVSASALAVGNKNLLWDAAFLARLAILAVIILNGVFLHLLLTPRLVKISLGARQGQEAGELPRLRRLALFLAGVLLLSWGGAFLLGYFFKIL